VIIPPAGSKGAADIRGGGPGTRETDVISALAGPHDVTAVLLTGGSAFGLAAADGVAKWCEEHGLGHETPGGRVPLVPAAVLYDLAEGRPDVRPGPDAGYAACDEAKEGVPQRGRVGAGSGAAVAKLLGREAGTPAGIGFAVAELASGETVAVVAAVNAMGDVIDSDGSLLAGPRGEDGKPIRTAEAIIRMTELPRWARAERESTTLACICTDASLDKSGCGLVARMASAGIARAVDPVFTPHDGDVVFALSSGTGRQGLLTPLAVGTLAATLTAEAIRDAVRSGREA
jgi:L-aminopeptidase/D-esterase-like protein